MRNLTVTTASLHDEENDGYLLESHGFESINKIHQNIKYYNNMQAESVMFKIVCTQTEWMRINLMIVKI